MARGCYPQSLGGNYLPQSVVLGAWQTVELSAVASYTLTVPQCGTHFAVEGQLRGDTAATETNLGVSWNGDNTTTNYHWQRVGAQNAAATVGEGNTFDALSIAAGTAVADYYTSFLLLFMEYRSARQKVCHITFSGELAAQNMRVGLIAHKRITAGVGALTDAITSLRLLPAAGNISGTLRYAALSRRMAA